MKLPLFQVDAFSNRPFAGNPAAVVPLTRWLADDVLQAIAQENNLAETAFMVATNHEAYQLRWFTPTTEVDLCGHATLAAAWVHFNRLGGSNEIVHFETCSGIMPVLQQEGRLVLDFPVRPGEPISPDRRLLSALGLQADDIVAVLQARDTLVVLKDEPAVAAVQPDMRALADLDTFGVIVSAPGRDCDFVSRFFAPAQGVAEDPVTGSAHCTLTPWWAEQLGKSRLYGRQISRRGGELWCTLRDDRVLIGGDAVCVLEGTLMIEGSK